MRARLRMRLAAWGTLAALVAASPAAAFDFFDGRLSVHGYAGVQIRALGQDFSTNNNIDLAQWYNVLNIEVESNLLGKNGWGPIEVAHVYTRVEARFDCVWYHACEMFPSVNVYGDDAEHLPKRLIDARQSGLTGQLENGDNRYFAGLHRTNYSLADRDTPESGLRSPLTFENFGPLVTLFGLGRGPNNQFEPMSSANTFGDDPPPYYFFNFLDHCKFAGRETNGPEGGQVWNVMGPWNPGCKIQENGALRNKPNPFSQSDYIPILAGVNRNTNDTADLPINVATGEPIVPVGRGELPFRPRPLYTAANGGAPNWEAQGLYYPSQGLVQAHQDHRLDPIDQNFSQLDLAWNRGESQQQTKELKEAYIDLEFAEGRLWIRLGKQNIVWGKTELFRNTDQFNPQDLALSSLPSLEESRIALWAARGTWSFYNIGKFEDVRLEVAVDLDEYKPADLGKCGEPFTLDVVCGIDTGYFAHGFSGSGLAGTDRPPSPWQSVQGLQGGARLEWRMGRFSFQLSDFYGYDDFPHPVRITTYERNVDPSTGRPRAFGEHGPCTTGAEPACLGLTNGVLEGPDGWPIRYQNPGQSPVPVPPFVTHTDPFDDHYNTGTLIISNAQRADVLAHSPENMTTFAFGSILCGIARANVDPALCGFVGVNGKEGPGAPLSTVANGFSALLAGSQQAVNSATGFAPYLCVYGSAVVAACRTAFKNSLVLLNQDPGDGLGPYADGGGPGSIFALPGIEQTLGQRLTPQQLALLGCGPYFKSDCDDDGIDPLNAEASVLVQSWPGFEGTHGSVFSWDLRNTSVWQPGTIGFDGGPVATRFVNGKLVVLPGARGPLLPGTTRSDPNYNPLIDGCISPAFGGPLCAASHPLDSPWSGQLFRTEMAAVSNNYMMVLVTSSFPINANRPTLSEFDPNDPFGTGIIKAGPLAGQVRPGVPPGSANGTNIVACGFYKPQLCQNVQSFLSGLGVSRNDVRAGGNGAFGRRDFAWDSGGEFLLGYTKRNVLGFAFDAAEDYTKTNWGVEATWVNRSPFIDNNQFDGLNYSGTFNLTISVDRPTFINFLNQGRTFFFNSQWFFQYISDYHTGFTTNGPLNVLATFTALTGYHQDRLLVSYTTVYDFRSNSGGLLPQVTYRFSESFSASLGINFFFGRQQYKVAPINEVRPGLDRVGNHAYDDAVENGLTVLQNRDEFFTTIRYTF